MYEIPKFILPLLSNSPIIVGEDDRFDYTIGEPDERFLTILRALRVCVYISRCSYIT
jgi:hypothetical protein